MDAVITFHTVVADATAGLAGVGVGRTRGGVYKACESGSGGIPNIAPCCAARDKSRTSTRCSQLSSASRSRAKAMDGSRGKHSPHGSKREQFAKGAARTREGPTLKGTPVELDR